jgi:CRP-like cAMP-binding protein
LLALATQSLVRVAAITSELSWLPHQVLYQEDSPAESMFLVQEGEVELRSAKMAQRRGENQVIGALAALGGGTHTESAVATQAMRALRIDREDFFDTMAEDFNVTRGILKALAGLANAAV